MAVVVGLGGAAEAKLLHQAGEIGLIGAAELPFRRSFGGLVCLLLQLTIGGAAYLSLHELISGDELVDVLLLEDGVFLYQPLVFCHG